MKSLQRLAAAAVFALASNRVGSGGCKWRCQHGNGAGRRFRPLVAALPRTACRAAIGGVAGGVIGKLDRSFQQSRGLPARCVTMIANASRGL